jgi:acetyl esterase/lipase
MSGGSIQTHAAIDPMLNFAVLQNMASNYIRENDPRSPYISPIYADLKGFPPLLIQVGSNEMLLDDSIRIAEIAEHAGVDVKLEIYDQMWHVWHLAARLMPEAKTAVNGFGLFIKNHFVG